MQIYRYRFNLYRNKGDRTGSKTKVKVVAPSPFYDGTYHPPLFKQLSLLYIEIYT
jgi:hypothetical protein